MSYQAHNMHTEIYNIGNEYITCVADFLRGTITVYCPLKIPIFKGFLVEYEGFDGDMREFAESKLKEYRAK